MKTGQLFFRPLTSEDVTESYVSWLNDPKINRFLEVRHSHQTIESCLSFVDHTNSNPREHLFGVFLSDSMGQHIGNCKLGSVDPVHLTGEISLFIGESECWGRGLGGEIIQMLTSYGFHDLSLEKITAGCYEENIGSLKAFLKHGYAVEGFLRNHVFDQGKRSGCFKLGLSRQDYLR